jgi:hypothetical protein
MNLANYVSVAEAAEIAGVSPERIRQLVAAGQMAGEKKAGVWLVLRADATRFVRMPNMGRPKRAKKKTRRKRG